jgi:hypothetical protein
LSLRPAFPDPNGNALKLSSLAVTMSGSPSPEPIGKNAAAAALDEMWYLALHCRMFLFAHSQLESLGLMETGAPAPQPIEANYHQFGAVHLLAMLCVVDSRQGKAKGYVHIALESLKRFDLIADLQRILDTPIYADVTFGDALKERRNYDRTHGNVFRPMQSIHRRGQKRSLEVYGATQIATGQHAFNQCWRQAVDAIGRLADILEEEMGRIAPPVPAESALVLREVLPRIGGAIGLHRPPRFIAMSLNPPGIQEFVDWPLKPESEPP